MESTSLPTREEELADEAFTSVFPNGLPPAKPSAGSAIVRAFPLNATHLETLNAHHESGRALGVDTSPRQKMSMRHHRVAQLLAQGTPPGEVAVVTGLALTTISILQSDPMFKELLNYYAGEVDEAFRDAQTEMGELALDVIAEIRSRLENSPQSLSASVLDSLLKTLADRTGNGPTSTNNINVGVAVNAADLARIKGSPLSRADESLNRPPRNVTPGHQSEGAHPSLDHLPTVINAPTVRETGVGDASRAGVGEEGPGLFDEVPSSPAVALPRMD